MATKKAPTKKAPQKPAAKPAVKSAAAKPVVNKVVEKEQTKMDVATAIFKRMAGKPRKEIIQAFITEAGLTKAGSGTYYAIIKKKL